MLRPFRKEDRILHENPFLAYEVPFNMMHGIADTKDALLLCSEDRRIIIAQSDPEMPMWIWVDPEDLDELVGRVILEMEEAFRMKESLKLVGTPQLLKSFTEKYPCTYQVKMVLEAYECRGVSMRNPAGIATLPSLSDISIIADFLAGFRFDALGVDTTRESQLENAKTSIRSGNLFVLRSAGEIVAMSSIAHRTARHARINNVYTPPAHRKKGYASMLVADLSQRILSEGLIPVLYTDLKNETSNKIYQEIGYRPCGKVNQYEIRKMQEV